MAVIDFHEHVVPRRGFLHPKYNETICTATELVAIMDRHGIDMMVTLPLSSPETYHFVQSNEEVFAACDQYPGRFIKFCNVDPRLEMNSARYDFRPILEYYKEQGARGVGEVTANLWWDDPRVQCLLEGCNAVGFPFLFHLASREFETYGLITEPDLGGLERALAKYPAVQFVGHSPGWWNHVGPVCTRAECNGYPKGKVRPGGRVPELLRRYPNIWGDLSAGSGYNAVSRDPEWGYDFIEEFQDRLLMGLDICLPSLEEQGTALLRFMREGLERRKISQVAYGKVMGGNAARLLNIAP